MKNIGQRVTIMTREHKSNIELFQMMTLQSFATLFHSYYISQFKQKYVPTHRIIVPSIRSFKDYINPKGEFMQNINKYFIDKIMIELNSDKYKKYLKCPELILFNEENIETFKTIFDIYIIPNIYKYLPNSFINMFSLNDDSQQMFIENEEFIFDIEGYLKDDIFSYLVDETLLQLFAVLKSIKKEIILPENNNAILVGEKDIVTICNEKALSEILIDHDLYTKYPSIIKLLCFVSSTSICQINIPNKSEEYSTNPFNEVSITKLGDVNV